MVSSFCYNPTINENTVIEEIKTMDQYIAILEKTLETLSTADLRKYARNSGLLTIELMRGEVERSVLIATILEDERKEA